MFCNSVSYGYGCPYSPHKRHVHLDDPTKCIYCGSSSIGHGCPYNPYGRVHIRGIEYNTMIKESIHKSVTAGIFISRLTQPITDTPAYKMGLIDKRGCKLRECINSDEEAALTPLDMYIFKIRRLVGENITELFKSNVLLEISSKQYEKEFNAAKYSEEIKISSDIRFAIDNLKKIYSEANQKGFSKNLIENLIIEAIITGDENTENSER